MKRRHKRLLMAGVGVLAVMGVAGFAVIATSENRPVIAALGSTWAVESAVATPVLGSHALDVQIELKAGDGTINRTPETFTTLCESLLGALPFAGAEFGAGEIFRVGINVISGGRLMFNQGLPVSVMDAECQQAASITDHTYLYPGELEGWALRGVNIAVLDGDTLDTSFEWTGGGDPDLDSFAYARACEALLAAPPSMAAGPLSEGAIRAAKIWAAKPIGEGRFTAKSRIFAVSDAGCEAS